MNSPYVGYNTFPLAPGETGRDYSDIYAAARFALTGDSQSADPTTAELAYPTPRELRKIIEANPCLGDKDTLVLSSDLTAADMQNLNDAAGAMVALSLLGTGKGMEYARRIIETKIGPDTEKLTEGVILADAKADLLAQAREALSRISCIAAFRASQPVTPLFGLAGRRRALESRRCGSPLYNGNRGGY